MSINDFKKLVKDCVKFYYDLAITKYPNLSSFAIVTDESYDTFIIAINTNKFFSDLENKIICDEDYWNTAEWTEECLDCIYENSDIEQVNHILNYDNGITEDIFMEVCLEALQFIREDKNLDICMFVHVTDYGSSKKLFNIVDKLNNGDVVESYKEYYKGYF